MRYLSVLFVIYLLFLPVGARSVDGVYIHHNIQAELFPEENRIKVIDIVTFPPHDAAVERHFLLHDGLSVSVEPGFLTEVQGPVKATDFGIKSGGEISASVPLKHYKVSWPSGSDRHRLVLSYEGKIYHPVKQLSEEYARSFSVSPGIICSEGVVLDGSSYWVPWFNDALLTFQLVTRTPPDWHSVSQGDLVSDEAMETGRNIQWRCDSPMDCIYLIAARFKKYEEKCGNVRVMAYLRQSDDSLAAKYLETTSRYMKMYSSLIGDYPYPKFALVENFWETGYGMPSFTLLGPQIIRFPFILHSSYPHELLHNWWGNSVFVAYESGNWCEGLTVYLADHLIKEQKGLGEEYRRNSLRRYLDYVHKNNDFPLKEFRSRYHAASEAVGYGKGMMVMHMLRMMLGDKTFVQGLRKFYRDNIFHVVGYEALREAFESVGKKDLSWFFEQWVERTGAPSLAVDKAEVVRKGDDSIIRFRLRQTQTEPVYKLFIPVAVSVGGKDVAVIDRVEMDRREQEFEIPVSEKPLELIVDPQFDVFRKLDREEIPPALSEIFGSERVLVILPSDESPVFMEGYRRLAETWAKGSRRHFDVVSDKEIQALPENAAVWIMGRENRFRAVMEQGLHSFGCDVSNNELRFERWSYKLGEKSVVTVCRHPENNDTVIVWLVAEMPEALDGLRRKLPHYGKYSYLVFEGAEPSNIAKGQWTSMASPMRVMFWTPEEWAETPPAAGYPPRHALAELEPVFSSSRMMKHIVTLSGESYEGRGFGSSGLDKAAEYIADHFREYGLIPGGEAGDYFSTWRDQGGLSNQWATLKNVIGVVPGRNPDFERESVLVTAHYDHLGLGWPDVHAGDEGKIHPGADDNASGVAVMLELARYFSSGPSPARSIIFVAFTGEECGRRGSRRYIETEKKYPPDKIIGVINLDTVGRLFGQKIMILGSESAREWPHIFMGCGFTSGAEAEIVTQPLDASDQVSFIEKGIPAVQIFSGPHRDYHRPTDTADKIDPEGLVKIAGFVKEAVSYLSERKEPLTVSQHLSPTTASDHPLKNAASSRKVTTGAMPDFTFSGKGVRLSDVPDDSPAGRAGLEAGDIIVGIDDSPITDLKTYADALKKHVPGDTVRILFIRKDHSMTASVTLAQR